MASPEEQTSVIVDPPGAVLSAVESPDGWQVVFTELPGEWDQRAIIDKLQKPWQALKEKVENRHEPHTYHYVFLFDEAGYQLGVSDYAEGVIGFSVGEDSVTIGAASQIDALRLRREAEQRLLTAYARRRESMEKLGIPTDPEGRKSFLMGKVGTYDKDKTEAENAVQLVAERQAVLDGTHPQLHEFATWPRTYTDPSADQIAS